MNLVPIDTAPIMPAAAEASTLPAVDFAALMAGLMTGDTQIAPALDVPTTEADPTEADADDSLADAAPMLGFMGAPPSGIMLDATPAGGPGPATDIEAADLEPAETPAVDAPGRDAEPASGMPALHLASNPKPTLESPRTAQPDVTRAPEEGTPLASVHPIRSDTSLAAHREGVEFPARPDAPVGQVAAEHSTTIAARPSAEQTAPILASPSSVTATLRPDTPAPERPIEPAADDIEVPVQDGEARTDTGTWIRTQVGRPATVPSGSVTVGIARRVEQAIAALATKPDPKIVTLQLDELDGVRLTVALRPDGIHLSSNGDASLTADIGRALASRGFDMASDSREQRREGSRDAAEDGWRPQTATRRRRTDQPGITL